MPEFLWKWRREVVFSILILISMGMLVSHHAPGTIHRTLSQGIAFVVVPFQKMSTALARRSRDTLTWWASIQRIHLDNMALKEKIERLQLRNALLQEAARENQILREQLAYRGRAPWTFIPAEIIGRDISSWLERVVVDRGSADGVKVGVGVVNHEGVVGRIVEVNLYSSTVMLLPDTQSSVAGQIERSRVSGTIKGAGIERLKMMHVSHEDDVQVGDRVLSSKLSSLFPPGLPIGTVTQVAKSENGLMLDIAVKPEVKFKTLDRMLIFQREE